MSENMENERPCFSELELQKQVWSGGRVLLSPREASQLDLGGPARRPLNPAMRPWRGDLGKGRAEEEEKKETGSSPLSQA